MLVLLVLQRVFLYWGILIVMLFQVPLTLLSNSKRSALFHPIAYDYSRADCDGLGDHLRDAPWEDKFKLGASAADTGFC